MMERKVDGRRLRGNFIRLRTAELKSAGINVGVSGIINAEWNAKSAAEKSSYVDSGSVVRKEFVVENGAPCVDGGGVDAVHETSGNVVAVDGKPLKKVGRKRKASVMIDDSSEVDQRKKQQSKTDLNVYKRLCCAEEKISWGMLTKSDLSRIKGKWNSLSDLEREVSVICCEI